MHDVSMHAVLLPDECSKVRQQTPPGHVVSDLQIVLPDKAHKDWWQGPVC